MMNLDLLLAKDCQQQIDDWLMYQPVKWAAGFVHYGSRWIKWEILIFTNLRRFRLSPSDDDKLTYSFSLLGESGVSIILPVQKPF